MKDKLKSQVQDIEKLEEELQNLDRQILVYTRDLIAQFDQRYPSLTHKKEIELNLEALTRWMESYSHQNTK